LLSVSQFIGHGFDSKNTKLCSEKYNFFYAKIPATQKVELKTETMKAKLGLIQQKHWDNVLYHEEDHFDLLPI
jgi:hypothetical protein